MIDVQEYQELRDRWNRANDEAKRAEGALAHAKEQLQQSFNVNTLSKAQKLLKEMKDKLNDLETRYTKQLNRFKKRWEDFLS